MTKTRTFLILILTLFAVSPAFPGRDRIQGDGRGRTPAPVISTAAIPQESPLASRLEAVPDIKAETAAGQVPRLPSRIPAVYRDKAKGPDVRVIWPSPKDNSQFLKPGTTTVTGKVPGTTFQPKATVTVKEASKTGPVPTRLVEAFPLGQVVLDRDTKGRDTPFIKNRDKFIRGLAGSESRQLPLQFQGRVRSEAAGRRQAARWLGQPDHPPARPRQRPLPVGHRPGLRRHDLR